MLRKLFGGLVSALLIATGLVVVPVAVAPANAAPPASAFDPGLIISDSVFYDFGSMTIPQIQSFLDSKVANCKATDPALDCLKSYKSEIPEVAATLPTETGPCLAISAKSGASAAEIIFTIANACGISPKVLLTTLQKEQGLVTSTKPTEYMYRAAMGFGCPDSDPGICGKVYVGLFNQIYRAAKQFRWYGNPAGSFTYWKPGRTVSMRFNPKSSCGTKSIELKSQATANLYYYTPYTPNDAALSNMYGTGDSCSAYGNRNFWRFYHDWFGSPIGGGYLLKAASGDTFLIVDSTKLRVTDARLISSLRPLGPLGEVSQAYLDSFTTIGDMGQLVKDTETSVYYLLVDGTRYSLTDCSLALEFGLSCDAAISLSDYQLSLFVEGRPLGRLIDSGTAKYWVEKGASRLVVDDLALSTVGAQSLQPLKMTIEQLTSLKVGAPLASDLLLFSVASSQDKVISSGGITYKFEGSLASELSLSKWFKTSPVSISASALGSALSQTTITGFVRNPAGATYVLTSNGKLLVTDPSEWTTEIITLPDAILNLIPTVDGGLAAPAMVTTSNTTRAYFVQSAMRKTSTSASMTQEFLDLLDQPKVITLPLDAVKAITHAGLAIAPGSLIKATGSNTVYLMDDLTRKIQLSGADQAKSVSDSKTYSFSKADLATLTTRTGFDSIKVSCDSATYLLDKGTLYPVSQEVSAKYPGNPYPLAISTCAGLNLSSSIAGQFIRDDSGTYYFISNGAKRKIKNLAHYKALVGDGPGYIQVSTYFASKLPNSKTAPSTATLASYSNVPNVAFDQLTFSGEVPPATTPAPVVTPSPAPSASPTPTPVTSPSPSPSATTSNPSTYKVVSGDTLNAIAGKFGVSVTSLQTLNNISDPRLLRIGQVLQIPGVTPSPTPTASQTAAPSPSPTPTPTPTATPTPAPPKADTVSYTVQSGDTLYRIAAKFGVSVSLIQSANNISNAAYIRVGQKLIIPTSVSSSDIETVASTVAEEPVSSSPTTYTVKSGDTLWGISRKLGVSSSELSKLNGITNPNYIRVGQVLLVP